MAYESQRPTIPKLYKVLENGKSCNGGSYVWDTTGGINVLHGFYRGQKLKHCNTGFHLTTDWRQWYHLGRDVYEAEVPGGEILIKAGVYDVEDKVVADSVILGNKNTDPLAKLLKDFHTDMKEVARNFPKIRKNRKKNGLKSCRIGRKTDTHSYLLVIDSHFVQWENPFVIHRADDWSTKKSFRYSVSYILGKLVKSIDHGISKKERQTVHDIWNLWKQGWIVMGYDKSTGQYVVR